MDFNVLSTQNWSRAFSIWIEDIQVVCQPVVTAPFQLQHSILRKFRALVRYPALVVVMLFCLHCTRPQAAPELVPTPDAAPDAALAEAVPTELTPGHIYTESGQASWYGGDDGFAGRPTANGETFDPSDLTCAHRTLPFGTRLEVRNLATGKHTIVRVNDRGPFLRGRILDVSEKAAKALGIQETGTARVRIRTVDAKGKPVPVDPAVLQGDPYTIQVAALSNPGNIARLSQELQSAIGPVSLLEAQTKGGVTIKRVRVGSYDRLEQAQKAAEEIAKVFKGQGLEPFITREH